jgi:FHA domain
MWNKPPPRGNEPQDPKRAAAPAPDPQASSDDAEQTVRIGARPERSGAAMAPQAGAESDAAAPLSRRPPAQRLSWPSRDQNAGNPANRLSRRDDAADAAQPRADGRALPQRGLDEGRPVSDDVPTTLYHPGRASAPDPQRHERGPGGDVEMPAAQDAAYDPVVGWLVIVEGPGKGRSLELGMGANAIGRNATQKIALDFGDHEIHREKHALLVYDPRSKRFFLQGSADARNLTYIGNDLVLVPVELKGGETIIVGQTHLRFIPLCGPDFSWS